VAALLHLFFMAAFSWMLVEGLLLWSKVVAVNLSEERHMKYYYLIGWGLPVLIVTITLASASGKYSADGYCWLSVQNGVIWGFTGPVIFIIMVSKLNHNPVMAAVKAVLVLLPILGLTWLVGVLVPFSIVMAYVFILLNSLQVQTHTHTVRNRKVFNYTLLSRFLFVSDKAEAEKGGGGSCVGLTCVKQRFNNENLIVLFVVICALCIERSTLFVYYQHWFYASSAEIQCIIFTHSK
uniref:G-protein coupled receptors family 2 profile 2 domain-containing protein n=1 Tax=Anabas testudineus TaxID=64144 RepID=A0A3Q1IL17_ANATE